MSTTAVSPAQILEAVYTDLDVWAKAHGGVCALSQNFYDLSAALQHAPTGWRVTIHWEGDTPADESVRAGAVVKNNLLFVMDGDLGPTAVGRLGLVRPAAGGRLAFLDIVQSVRERVMAYQFGWLREPLNRFWYLGADDKTALPGDLFAAAYNLRFMVYSQMPMPTETVALLSETP